MSEAQVKQEVEMNQKEPDAQPEAGAKSEQMCCDGKRTAAEHRHESGGKCCSDS